MDTQEWQQENSIRAFPFAETILAQQGAGSIPVDFIVDLRLVPDRHKQIDVYISQVIYTASSDSYQITISYVSDNSQAMQFTIVRRSSSGSRVGVSTAVSSGTTFLLFTPGKGWDNVSGDQTSNYTVPQAMIDDAVVNPGPDTIKRVFIEPLSTYTTPVPPIPPYSSWGKNVVQRVVEGYNVSITPDALDPKKLVIDAVPGAGGGYPAASGQEVMSINGVKAGRANGDFILVGNDCIHNIENPVTSENVPIPNTVQFVSHCIPCCSCEQYRAVSAAITKQSNIIKTACDYLSNMITANAALYNEAVAAINAARIPIAQVRNLRVYPNYFVVSVQNVCNIPLYVHFSLQITQGNIAPFTLLETSELTTNLSILPPLAGTPKDYSQTAPLIPSSGPGKFSYITVNPLNPGGAMDLTFSVASSSDLRVAGLGVSCQTNGVYGANKNYGCVLDNYSAQVESAPAITTTSCGKSVTIPQFKIVQLHP